MDNKTRSQVISTKNMKMQIYVFINWNTTKEIRKEKWINQKETHDNHKSLGNRLDTISNN